MDADCADASACTTAERCVAGACLSDPVSCDDHEPCTTDSCDLELGCHNIPVVNGIACGDGNVCNGIETCQAGACSNGTPPPATTATRARSMAATRWPGVRCRRCQAAATAMPTAAMRARAR
jgi:hypothetical protein